MTKKDFLEKYKNNRISTLEKYVDNELNVFIRNAESAFEDIKITIYSISARDYCCKSEMKILKKKYEEAGWAVKIDYTKDIQYDPEHPIICLS